MPSSIKPCDCDCADQTDACTCDSVTAALDCSNRGGSTCLIGFAPFAAPFNKRYRRLTKGGIYVENIFGGACPPDGGFLGQNVYQLRGSCGYDRVTGDFSTNATLKVRLYTGFTSEDSDCSSSLNFGGCAGATTTHTSKVGFLVDTLCFGTGPIYGQCVSDNQTVSLSEEDTEGDAIDRLLRGANWSGRAPASSCGSIWTELNSSLCFTYILGRFGVTASGMRPDHAYTLTLDIYQRSVGVGVYRYIGQLSTTVFSDAKGKLDYVGEVPISKGSETYVTNPKLKSS